MQESYFLKDDIRGFDAPFFNISAREAESIDPQQRLLMETVYEAMESAGLRISDLQGTMTGIYCGQMCDDYSQVLARDIKNLPRYTSTGLARNNTSNRVSYFFNWHGPSMTIDTACSSSMVAVHLAVNALRDGDCKIAIASGTNLILSPTFYISASNLGMLSPTGRSRMWDAEADGYARGEGVAAVALKRLSDAIADGDPIQCIIRETSINQDGRSMGITMPSSVAQAKLIQATYAKAGLDLSKPEDRPQYFEAHGMGTQAGDPEEAAAISKAFYEGCIAVPSEQKMYVGSIKTVIGHTEGTAGLAGLIKACLCIQHNIITPNLLFRTLNPRVAPFCSNLQIPTAEIPWPSRAAGVPNRASVNSFGFGGTNAHVILEGWRKSHSRPSKIRLPAILPFAFSATSERAVGAMLRQYHEFLIGNPSLDLVDMAWSLLSRREQFSHRLVLWAPSIDALKAEITAELERRQSDASSTIIVRGAPSQKILGVFTGQGAQWPQMGLDLITQSCAAKLWFEELQASLDELPRKYQPKATLMQQLSAAKELSHIDEPFVSQPVCTALQIILVNILRECGISFAGVVGHSSGEIGAAYAAGFLTASSAIRIAHLRGIFAGQASSDGPPGAMIAATLSPEEAQDICLQSRFSGRLNIAAVNSPSSITLSGNADAIQDVQVLLNDKGRYVRALKVKAAYHSHHMLACSGSYTAALINANIEVRDMTSASWLSSVHGGRNMDSSDSKILAAAYWTENMTGTVQFVQAVTAALKEKYDIVIEMGPHPALKGPFTQIFESIPNENTGVPYVSTLMRGTSGIGGAAKLIGSLWAYLGADAVCMAKYIQLFDKSRVPTFLPALPYYPFDHTQSYWVESRLSKCIAYRKDPPSCLLGTRSPEAADGEWRWRNYLRRETIPWLDDHQIQSQTVFPAAGFVGMALEAAKIVAGIRKLHFVEVSDLIIESAISMGGEGKPIEITFKVENLNTKGTLMTANFSCDSAFSGSLRRCAHGTLKMALEEESISPLPPRSQQSQRMLALDVEDFYSYLYSLGYGYTGSFRGISSLTRCKDTASGTIVNAQWHHDKCCVLHPGVMDTLLQTILAAIGVPGDGRLSTLCVPIQIDRVIIDSSLCVSFTAPLVNKLLFDASVTDYSSLGIKGNAALFNQDGKRIVHMEGVQIRPLSPLTPSSDRRLFSTVAWGPMHPNAMMVFSKPSGDTIRNAQLKEQAVLLLMRDILAAISAEDRAQMGWHQKKVVNWFEHVVTLTKHGKHPTCRREWIE